MSVSTKQFNTLSCRLVPALPTKPQNPAASLGKMNQFSWVIHRNLVTSFTLRLCLPLDQQGDPIHRAAASKGAGGQNLPSDQLGANKTLAPQGRTVSEKPPTSFLWSHLPGRKASFLLLYLPCILLQKQYSKVFVRVFGNINRDKMMV